MRSTAEMRPDTIVKAITIVLVLVPGAHHFPMADAPDVVASAIRSWWHAAVAPALVRTDRDCARAM